MHERHLPGGRTCYSHELETREAAAMDLLRFSDGMIVITALLAARYGSGLLRMLAMACVAVAVVRWLLLVVGLKMTLLPPDAELVPSRFSNGLVPVSCCIALLILRFVCTWNSTVRKVRRRFVVEALAIATVCTAYTWSGGRCATWCGAPHVPACMNHSHPVRRDALWPPSVYYINLHHRSDRRAAIERELLSVFPQSHLHRVNATYHQVGWRGCRASHIAALERAFCSGTSMEDYVLVFEDDFAWSHSPKNAARLLRRALHSSMNWNIILLSAICPKLCPALDPRAPVRPALNCQTTGGYAIRRSFIPRLLGVWTEPAEEQSLHAIDITWKKLQLPADKFYVAEPMLGAQTKSYSDIEGAVVDYSTSMAGARR